MLPSIAVLVVGLVVLVVGADLAVDGARTIARRLGVSELVIGLTLTSIGTSLPELATSAKAALVSGGTGGSDAAGVAVGNLLGSNLFLLTALLGMSAIARTIRIDPGAIWRDGGALLGATVATLAVMVGGTVSRVEGGLLMLGYASYLGVVAVQERRRIQDGAGTPEADAAAADPSGSARLLPWWLTSAAKVAGGLAGVISGANLVVDHGVEIATIVGVPGTLVGIFVGVGTSLPELVVSVQAAIRGASDISVGNIVGSGITNLLLCLGAAAAAHDIAVPATALAFDLPFLLVSTLIALALMVERLDVTRAEGVVLCLLFAFYLYLRAAGVVA